MRDDEGVSDMINYLAEPLGKYYETLTGFNVRVVSKLDEIFQFTSFFAYSNTLVLEWDVFTQSEVRRQQFRVESRKLVRRMLWQ